jgi:hypothetical protein
MGIITMLLKKGKETKNKALTQQSVQVHKERFFPRHKNRAACSQNTNPVGIKWRSKQHTEYSF